MDEEVPLLSPGTILGSYEVLEHIGSGAMAHVYRARHRTLGAEYALKQMYLPSKQARQRFLQEGKVQAQLRHRNIVSVTDVVDHQGRMALVMELVHGADLEKHIQQNHPMPIHQIQDIGRGLIRGVRAAHKAGHLHRDLKPANVLMTLEDEEWVPKVADFGLAKVQSSDDASFWTKTGSVMGTPAYMAPEQARDSKNIDHRADIFSIGCILYELMTGTIAFDAPGVVATMARAASGAYTPIPVLRDDVPEGMTRAVEACLATDPANRIPDCETLLDVWMGRVDFLPPVGSLHDVTVQHSASASPQESLTDALETVYDDPIEVASSDTGSRGGFALWGAAHGPAIEKHGAGATLTPASSLAHETTEPHSPPSPPSAPAESYGPNSETILLEPPADLEPSIDSSLSTGVVAIAVGALFLLAGGITVSLGLAYAFLR